MQERHTEHPPIQEDAPDHAIELIYHVVLLLNAFLTKSGVSTMLLPCKIVQTHKLYFKKHGKAQFGANPDKHNGYLLDSGNHPQPDG
jgi:hypothetical protein